MKNIILLLAVLLSLPRLASAGEGDSIISFHFSSPLGREVYIIKSRDNVSFQKEDLAKKMLMKNIIDTTIAGTHVKYQQSIENTTTTTPGKTIVIGDTAFVDDGRVLSFYFNSEEDFNKYHAYFIYSENIYGIDSKGDKHYPIMSMSDIDKELIDLYPQYLGIILSKLETLSIQEMLLRMIR